MSGYYSRNPNSAKEAATFTNSRYYERLELLVDESDAIFITVPDQAIRSVYDQICQMKIRNKFICHCSGALSSKDAFFGIQQTGAHGVSIHPLFPVSSKYDSYRELTGAFFCIEGDEAAILSFQPLLEKLGVQVQKISPEVKTRYHAACVMSSNFMCALMQKSVELLESCGFTQELAIKALAPLMRSNLHHLLETNPTTALTGPVERCDVGTVKKHLKELTHTQERQLYCLLSQTLVTIAQQKNPKVDYTAMLEVLKNERN